MFTAFEYPIRIELIEGGVDMEIALTETCDGEGIGTGSYTGRPSAVRRVL